MKGMIAINIVVNNHFKDEKHKKENISRAFVEMIKSKGLDDKIVLMVSCRKALSARDTEHPKKKR